MKPHEALALATELGVIDEMPELRKWAANPGMRARYYFWEKIRADERKLLRLAKKEKARRLTRAREAELRVKAENGVRPNVKGKRK